MDTNERGEALLATVIICLAIGILSGVGAQIAIDEMHKPEKLKQVQVDVQQGVDWDSLPNEGEIR